MRQKGTKRGRDKRTKGDVHYLSTFVRPAEEIKTVGVDYYNTYGQKMRNYSTYNGIISENGLRIENGMNVRISYLGWYK